MSPAALDATECLPTIDELDSEPLVEELGKAIGSLASGKAHAGNDGIPPDLIKHCKTIPYCSAMLEVVCQFWKEEAVPQDTRDSKIITLYENNGERNDCNNLEASPYTQHYRQSICAAHTHTPPEAGGAYLPGSTMWLPS